MSGLTPNEEAQLLQTIEMFEVIAESQADDVQSLEILKEAYSKLGREVDAVRASKRIADAYLHLGQLSNAILEYETILQQHPDDPDVQKALADIEKKAESMTASPMPAEVAVAPKTGEAAAKPSPAVKGASVAVEDGREVMHKLYVDGKHISQGDFDLCWFTPDPSSPPGKVVEPFLQVLHDKNLMPIVDSLRVLCEKSALGYIPLDRYDLDIDLARKFPKDTCLRWCVLPFDRMSKSVMVATANPFNKQAAKELSEATKDRIIWYICPPADMAKALKKVFKL